MTLYQWWHRTLTRHDHRMRVAGLCVETGLRMRDWGSPEKGWEFVQEAIALVVRCGCPEDMWPDKVKEILP